MYFKSLPATISSGEKKGQQSNVEITAAKLVGADGKPHKYVIPAEKFVYPQFGPEPSFRTEGEGEKAKQVENDLTEEQAETVIQEFLDDIGGKVKAAYYINRTVKDRALSDAKNYIRTRETGSPSEIEAQGLKNSKEFTLAEIETKSNKEIAQEAADLAEMADKLPLEELVARLKAIAAGKK